MRRSRESIIEFLLIFGALILTNVFAALWQEGITVNDGKGWDGIFYYHIADEMAHGANLYGTAPFIYRLGTPFLAALLDPHELLEGFFIANIIAGSLCVGLIVIWLQSQIDNRVIRMALTILFVVLWSGPVRFTYFYPATSDPWGMVFLFAGLVCLNNLNSEITAGRLIPLCLICLIGTPFREIVAIVGVSAIFLNNPLRFQTKGLRVGKVSFILILPLACSFLGIVLSHVLVTRDPSNHYSFLKAVARWGYQKSLAEYIEAWLIVYGPLLFVPIFWWREAGRILWNQQYQMAFLIAVALLAWMGGGDNERFVLWATPVVFGISGRVMQQNREVLSSKVLIAFLVAMELISTRLFWTTPDEWGGDSPSFIFLSPITNASYLNLLSHWAPWQVMALSLFEYGCVGVVLFGWLFYRQNKGSSVKNARDA